MAGYDQTNPTDNSIVSQFPTNERAQRSAVASAIGLEHDTAGAGRHKFPTGNTSARDALTGMNEGTLFVNSSAGAGNYYVEIFASATSVWETTGRFTSADSVKLGVLTTAATTVTSAEIADVSVTAMRQYSPANIGTFITTHSLNTLIIVNATRDMTAATGTQAVTGAGGTPIGVRVIYGVNGTTNGGTGHSDGTTDRTLSQNSSNQWNQDANFIRADPDGINSQVGTVQSLDSDGITISWTKNGSPSAGTLNMSFEFIF